MPRIAIAALLLLAVSSRAHAQDALGAAVDVIVEKAMKDGGVPGAWVAVVKDGALAYSHAYGDARVAPKIAARLDMGFPIASNSKQIVATAVLLLAEDGKLKLDDPVAKYFPDLTRAKQTTIRQLLSHTSGYQDNWPQDYVYPDMMKDTTPEATMDHWAKKPLDFDPGTKYQYSNTGYTIAGRIVEKASGKPLMQFLHERIFAPLGMSSVRDFDDSDAARVAGHIRYGLGPLRDAPKIGKGWVFGCGQLVMTVDDVARWDISMIDRRLLRTSSYVEMQTDVLLKNGMAKNYGLGIGVKSEMDHRLLGHFGGLPGLRSANWVFPDDRAAVVVFVNVAPTEAAAEVARNIAPLLFSVDKGAIASYEGLALRVFRDLQKGKIDRTLFSDNANAYFTEQALRDFRASLAPLGDPPALSQLSQYERGGMTYRDYRVKLRDRTVIIKLRHLANGKLEQYMVLPAP
jgi:CubicO group peptidase (beta-lactamase class C family)